MATTKEIIYKITGDVSGLEVAINKANSLTNDVNEATKESAQVTSAAADKAAKSAEKLTKADTKLTKAAEDLSDASAHSGKKLKDLGEAAGDADGKLKALAGAVGVVSPELAGALTAAGDLAGGFEILTMGGTSLIAVLGPVAAAVGVLAAAYLVLKKQVDDANEAMEESAKTATEAEDYSYRVAELRRQEAVLVGELSEDEADLARISEEAERKIADVTEASAEAINEKKTALDEALSSVNTGALAVKELTAAYEKEVSARDEAIDRIIVERDLKAGLILAKVEAAKAAEDEAEALKKQAEAQKARAAAEAEALKREAEAAKQLATEKADMVAIDKERIAKEKEALQIQEAALRAAEALASATRDLQESQLEGIDAIVAARDRDLRKLTDLYEAALELAKVNSEEQLQIEEDYQAGKAEIEAQYQEAAAAEKDRIAEEDKARIQSITDASMQAASMLGGAVSEIAQTELDERKAKAEELKAYLKDNRESLTEAERAAVRARIKEEKAAARKIANIQKVLAISQIAIDTAQGIMAVWAQWAATPPVAVALSAIVGAVGIAQGIAVARQKTEFATGGIKRGATDAEDALPDRLSAGEAVLTRSAVARLGEDGVAAINSGRVPQQPAQVTMVWKNKVFDPFISEINRVGGSLNDIIMAAGRTPGHSRRPA